MTANSTVSGRLRQCSNVSSESCTFTVETILPKVSLLRSTKILTNMYTMVHFAAEEDFEENRDEDFNDITDA